MRKGLAITFLALATAFVASSASALPPGTPIFRACMQAQAAGGLWGGASLFGGSSISQAIDLAHSYCLNAGLRARPR